MAEGDPIEASEQPSAGSKKVIIWVVIGLIISWVVFGLIAPMLYLPGDTDGAWDRRAGFGDMFGAVNALFSGAALIGVIYAVLLQREELALQREELALNREELRRSAEAQEQSADGLLEQTQIQNRLLNAQLLKDRFEMYWRMYEPVTDDEVKILRDCPQTYMSDRMNFEANEDIRVFIYISRIYEYLAFTSTLKDLQIEDPLGEHWIGLWTSELLLLPVFLNVHEAYRGYYPQFEAFVDEMIEERVAGTSGSGEGSPPAGK